MLTGPELGQAIKGAIKAKKLSQRAIAKKFGVEPPSVTGWINDGRIEKSRLMALIEFCSDVVGPEHWGLPPHWTSGAAAHAPAINAVAGLSPLEQTLLDAFRKLKEPQASLVMQVAFGLDPRQMPAHPTADHAAVKTTAEVFDSWKERLLISLEPELDAYHRAATDDERRVIEARIGGRVVDILDRRRRQADPPDHTYKRASDLK